MPNLREINVKKKPTAILTADIEIRSFQPTCRTDDHWEAQARKIAWLKDLQAQCGCPIFDAGDLFDKKYKSYPSHKLLEWSLKHLPHGIITIAGNHDLPGKTMENYKNSAMAVLESAGFLSTGDPRVPMIVDYRPDIYLYGFPWGVERIDPDYNPSISVALIHEMVYEEFEPFPGCSGFSAEQILDSLPSMDLIVTGHHHKTFVLEKDGRILVNPGSLMRNDADQEDHRPSVFLWYAQENRIEQVFVPIEKGVITRDHIVEKKEKESRLDAFVEKLGQQTIDGINFSRNLEVAIKDNELSKSVEDKIWKYYEGKK